MSADDEELGPRKRLKNVNEARRELNIGRTKFYDLLKSGQLKAVKIGRRRLVPVQAIDAFIDSLCQ